MGFVRMGFADGSGDPSYGAGAWFDWNQKMALRLFRLEALDFRLDEEPGR